MKIIMVKKHQRIIMVKKHQRRNLVKKHQRIIWIRINKMNLRRAHKQSTRMIMHPIPNINI